MKLDAYLVTYNPNKVRTNTYCFQKLVVSQCSWHLMLFVFAVKMLTQNKNRNKAKTRIRLCFTSPSMRLVNPKYFYRQSVTNLVSTCNNTNSLKNYRNNIMNHCDTWIQDVQKYFILTILNYCTTHTVTLYQR